MGQEILKEWQRIALEYIFAQPEAADFYLTGGTALAAYFLHHRLSDDLDFFSEADFPTSTAQRLAEGVRTRLGTEDMRYMRVHDRRQFVLTLADEELKIEFTHYPFRRLHPLRHWGAVRTDDEREIAVNKLMALTDRFEPKDFVDLYFLLPKYPLSDLREGVRSKFGFRLDPVFLGGELMKVQRVAALPKMVRDLSQVSLKEFFLAEAARLRAEVIEDS